MFGTLSICAIYFAFAATIVKGSQRSFRKGMEPELSLEFKKRQLFWSQCPAQSRGCNPPATYANIALKSGNSVTENPIHTSANFKQSLLDAIRNGTNDIRFHIGTASNTESFLLEPNGPTAAYEGLVKEMCKFDKHLCNINDVRAVADAQKGGGQYYLSARRDCGCQQIIHDGNPLYYLPNENDDANMVYFRAIHEYTHAVQKSFFGDVPNWLMEGPAVYNECIFSNKPSFSTESFASCMRNNIRGAVELYRSDYKTYLTTYGADRGCSGPAASDPNNPVPPNGYVPGGDDAVHKLYYNVGPVATAFAIAKAANKSSDQGGIVEFWTGTGKKGYWHSVEEYPLDPWSGWASQVPEGKGWKKALADFTGYSTTADFYAAFENWIAPGGQVKTVDELMELVTTYPFQQSNVEKARDTIANFGNIAPRLPKDTDGKVCSGTSQSRLGWICQLLIPLAILFLTSA